MTLVRSTALLLTVATGFAGLVYEVAWQKVLATLLGSHAGATAAVLGLFLGGLAGGYAAFGALTRRMLRGARTRPARLLYAYALVELGIGLYALAFPTFFGFARGLSLLGPGAGGGLGFAFDVTLSALLIGPPAVLMGGTIPFLTLALADGVDDATRVHALVYGANTIGAFAGALAAGFLLIPSLGLDGTVYAMACVNLIAAAIFAQLDRGAPHHRAEPAATPRAGSVEGRFASWYVVSLLAGFSMMALQTTFNRIGALALGASQFTFAMVVAVFVLCIALGSLAVSLLPRIPRGLVVGTQWTLVLLLGALYFEVGNATYWAHVIHVLFRPLDAAFHAYHFLVFTAALAVLALPIGLSGALLPLLFDHLRRDLRDLGAVAGRLYAWNTIGSLLGALLGGYVLLFWLDLHHVYRVALAALAVGAALLTGLVLRRRSPALPALLGAVALAGIAALPAWSPERLGAGLFRLRQPTQASFLGPDAFFAQRARRAAAVLFYDDDPVSSVSVLGDEPPENRSLIVNGKPDGNLIADYPTMALSALLPALMAERIESAFVIGWGTGVTTGELGALEETRRVRVAEISPAVIDAAGFFDAGNLGAIRNPKVDVRIGDAYRTLLQSDERYDLIVSEPSNPWVTGVEMLYSRDFLEAARSRLAPGGVYAQWFHVYESDVAVVELVLRTYASVFPHVSVWFALGSDLLLLGFDRDERALDVRRLEERFARPDFAAGFQRCEVESFAELLAHELLPLGVLHAGERSGPVHTLRHPILSYRAARAFFRGREARLPPTLSPAQREVASRTSLLRRRYASDGILPEAILEAAARESCQFSRFEECATLFARWAIDHPDSRRLPAALAEARRGDPAERSALAPRRLSRLRSFFAKGGDGASAARGRPEQMTASFLRHYHHAAPFDLAALDAIWSRCRGDDCDERRRRAEARLGASDGEEPTEGHDMAEPTRGILPRAAGPERESATATGTGTGRRARQTELR